MQTLALLSIPFLLTLVPAAASQNQCDFVNTNETDSGGDPCSYYGQHHYFCSCCDTPTFKATRDCCECQYSQRNRAGGLALSWASVFHLWPRKATALKLPRKYMKGTLPADIAERWPNLEEIDLSRNELTGVLPPQLGNLSRLRVLNLRSNRLSGHLPPELGRLTALRELWLFSNGFDGHLPPELGNLAALEDLRLYRCQFSGGIPAELGRLTALRELHLHQNQLTGPPLSEIGRLTALQVLYLQRNQLTGPIPSEIGRLTALRRLDLSENRLSGTLPSELGHLSLEAKLALNLNNFSGSIPRELGRLTGVEALHLEYNNFSGYIPPELGSLPAVKIFHLQHNKLEGPIPPELRYLAAVVSLRLDHNRLSGALPSELSNLTTLRWLYLSNNQLSGGLPTSFRDLPALRTFTASDNPGLCGDSFATLKDFPELRTLWLAGCCFEEQHLPDLPPKIENLDMSRNHLSRVPERWHVQGENLEILLLNNNSISQWNTSSIVPLSESTKCGFAPPAKLFSWEQLRILDVSWNPLNMLAFNFLESLCRLPQLSDLQAHDANLTGPLPQFFADTVPMRYSIVPGYPHRGTPECTGMSFVSFRGTFQTLAVLDLSGNAIESLDGEPSQMLVQADLSRNALTTINPFWWQGGRDGFLKLVDVRGNPGMHRTPVRLDPSSVCPETGTTELTANPYDWSSMLDGRAECTTLCRMEQTLFHPDLSLNTDVLCRCSWGQGTGLDCSPCPNNTYSSLFFENGHYSRECLDCPENSALPNGEGTCFANCGCAAGTYMAQKSSGTILDVGTTPCSRLAREGQCAPCGPFKSSVPGSTKAADCFCDGHHWEGLLERQGQCGCPVGSHINFADRRCQPCQSDEDCGEGPKSLLPPTVKAGYWALPPPPQGSDGMFGNFSRHSIWRCRNTKACTGNSTCGQNRRGTACSLCKPGHFQTPAGSCAPCPHSHTQARGALAGLLLACTVIPTVAHFHLKSRAGAEPQGLAMALRSVSLSLKQLVGFAQILAVVSLFSVEWPPAVEEIFAIAQAFFMGLSPWARVACLDAKQEQSMTLELTFRWMLPLAGVLLTCLAALVVNLCGLVLNPLSARYRPQMQARVRQLLSFHLMDGLRVLVFFLDLLFPSLLKNALFPLTCAPSPNGLLTMSYFPHTVCWSWEAESEGSEDFWSVAVPGLVQSLMLAVGFPLLLLFAWKRIDSAEAIAVTSRQSMLERSGGWWAFLFEDFRRRKTHWALLLVCKDIVLNLVVVILPQFGTLQLLVTSIVSIGHACLVFCSSPYPDVSNTVLETCAAAGVAAVCIFSAGMGFQSEPDVVDVGASIVGGREGPNYLRRAMTLLSIQVLTLVGPVAIIVFQVLVAFPRSQRCVPRRLRPLTKEQREEWSESFTLAMGIRGGPLPRAVAEFDAADFFAFKRAVTRAPAAQSSLSMSNSTLESSGEKEEEGNSESPAMRALQEENMALQAQLRQREEAQLRQRKEAEEEIANLRQREEAQEAQMHQREDALQLEIAQLKRQAGIRVTL